MSAFVLSPDADEDIWTIWQYLAQDAGISVANYIETELYEAFEKLARSPGIGHRCSTSHNTLQARSAPFSNLSQSPSDCVA
jgi:plasmid stabilization system protein ParE